MTTQRMLERVGSSRGESLGLVVGVEPAGEAGEAWGTPWSPLAPRTMPVAIEDEDDDLEGDEDDEYSEDDEEFEDEEEFEDDEDFLDDEEEFGDDEDEDGEGGDDDDDDDDL